jgi:alpha/beta superfamily hydrolase
MKEERVLIPSTGIQLEGLLSLHEGLSFKGGMIFCHPHPLYGGDMDNPVITTAAEAASQEGFSTLRFNFRGVGESEGTYGEGVGEGEDVKAAIDFFYSKLKSSNSYLILLGYSFGAWAGFPIAIREGRVQGMVAIAPPLELHDFGYLKGCNKRKLFIAGDRDLYCPTSLLEELYETLDEPKSIAIIPGADHFFFSHTRLLTQPLMEFLKTF